jgi:hypothetical protein
MGSSVVSPKSRIRFVTKRGGRNGRVRTVKEGTVPSYIFRMLNKVTKA